MALLRDSYRSRKSCSIPALTSPRGEFLILKGVLNEAAAKESQAHLLQIGHSIRVGDQRIVDEWGSLYQGAQCAEAVSYGG